MSGFEAGGKEEKKTSRPSSQAYQLVQKGHVGAVGGGGGGGQGKGGLTLTRSELGVALRGGILGRPF